VTGPGSGPSLYLPMDTLLVFPDPPPPELAQSLDLGRYAWKAVASILEAEQHERDSNWGGAVIGPHV